MRRCCLVSQMGDSIPCHTARKWQGQAYPGGTVATATAPRPCGEPFALLILFHRGPSCEADAVFPPILQMGRLRHGEAVAEMGSGGGTTAWAPCRLFSALEPRPC